MLKPNVLWICTDQQRFDTLGCYGNDKIDTPNLDALAQEGVLFENTYCQSPVCSPSRASFLTGRYPRTCRVRQNGQRIPKDEILVSRLFSENGYTAGLVGKLHIAPCHTSVCKSSEERIEDGYSIFNWSHHPDFYGKDSNWPLNEYNIWLQAKGREYKRVPYKGSPYLTVGPDQEDSHSHWCAEKSMEFIQAHQAYSNNPWFLSVHFYDPHHDFDPCQALLEKYLERLGAEDLPNYTIGELHNKAKAQRTDHKGAYGVAGWYAYDEMKESDHLAVKAAYYAMIEQLDTEVGRIIDKLKRTGQYENTMIVFHSDHGEMLGDHGIYLKGGYFYEPMVKVPLIISWPGKLAGGVRRKALVELVDIAPALLSLCGEVSPRLHEQTWKGEVSPRLHEQTWKGEVSPRLHEQTWKGLEAVEGMQGKSLEHLLLPACDCDTHRDTAYCEYYNSMRHNGERGAFATMVVSERYKLCYYHDENLGELYDLETDSRETYNLYYNTDYKDIRIEMLEKMINRMAFTSDPLPLREAAY